MSAASDIHDLFNDPTPEEKAQALARSLRLRSGLVDPALEQAANLRPGAQDRTLMAARSLRSPQPDMEPASAPQALAQAPARPMADYRPAAAPPDSGELPQWLTSAITPAGMPMSRRARDQYALNQQGYRLKAAMAKAKGDDADDPNSPANVAHRETLSALYPEQMARLPEAVRNRITTKTSKPAEDRWKADLGFGAAMDRGMMMDRSMANIAAQKEGYARGREERVDVEQAQQLEAPGWVRTPGAPPIKREEAAGFRTSLASAQELSQAANRMRALIKAHGSELYGPKRAEMANLSRDMLLKMKDLAKLGVLSQSDEGILNDLIPNPTGMQGATTSNESMLAQLDAFDTSIARKLGAQAKSLGYSRPGESRAAPETPPIPGGWSDDDEKRLQELEAKAKKPKAADDMPVIHSGHGGSK